MSEMFANIKEQLVAFGPTLLAGLAVLVVGWLVAILAARLVRRLLSRTSVDNKVGRWMSSEDSKSPMPIEDWAGHAVFYLIMLIVLIAFFATIKLTMVTEPLNAVLKPFLAYLPRLVGALALILVAWVLATALRNLIRAALKAANLDEKMGVAAAPGSKPMPLSQTFADVVYWLVFLIFLPLVLQSLDLQALLEPVTTMFNKAFAFLPNLVSAAAILAVGWFIARIAHRFVQGLLASAGLDRLSERWGLAASLGKQTFSGVIGLVVYYVILVPVLISALAALKLEAITRPATDMLGKMMDALPNIIGASLVVLIAIVIGKVVSGIVSNVLAGVGFNNVLVRLGLAKEPPKGRQTPAAVVGTLILAVVVLLASVTAADMLGFRAVGVLIHDFIRFAGQILMAILIFALGLLLAQVVGKAVSTSDLRNAGRLAMLARGVILVLAGAMALRQTGVADDIVNLAFGLTLGAVAVAFAVAFGLGGRDMAARTLEEWRASQSGDKPRS